MVNQLERRSGSLWEGRYKSSPIETDRYLLACCRYVELNPVRARMVDAPGDYKWSSYLTRVGDRSQEWLDKDPCYLGMGATDTIRQRCYRAWVESGVPEAEIKLIREALQRGQLTGSERFISETESMLQRRIGCRGKGRPRKDKK